MKIDRLIGIITLLLREDKVTAPELARRFEVSRRTIGRDIEDICKAGIPLITTQGYGGGISVAEGYRLDKTLFTQDELETILAGLNGMKSISDNARVNPLFDKLFRKNSRVITEDHMIIDLASHYQASLTQKIELIKQAISDKRMISFRYYYSKGESVRVIEPYRIVFKWSAWYVFGYCSAKTDFRLFKLNRLWDLKESEKTFQPREITPEMLDFDEHFSEVQAHLKAVFLDSEKYRLIEEYGVNCYTVTEHGTLLFERDFASYDNMREWVFSFGDKVSIQEPAMLKEDRLRQAANILHECNQT